MSNTQERIRQRREYLKEKGKVYVKATKDGFAAIWFTLYTLVMLCLAWQSYHKPSSLPFPLLKSKIAFCSLLFVFGIAVPIMVWQKLRSMRQRFREAKQLPYVAPVTANTLPAEEVLVRGSEEPTQEQGRVLLRGTDGSAGTGEQELLRSSQRQE